MKNINKLAGIVFLSICLMLIGSLITTAWNSPEIYDCESNKCVKIYYSFDSMKDRCLDLYNSIPNNKTINALYCHPYIKINSDGNNTLGSFNLRTKSVHIYGFLDGHHVYNTLNHEMCHSIQYEKLGLYKMNEYYQNYSYMKNPLEIEADKGCYNGTNL